MAKFGKILAVTGLILVLSVLLILSWERSIETFLFVLGIISVVGGLSLYVIFGDNY